MLQKIRSTVATEEFQLVANLLKNLSIRFPGIESNLSLAQPTYLDPRFKKKGFTDDNCLKSCKDSLLISMNRYKDVEKSVLEPTHMPLPVQKED